MNALDWIISGVFVIFLTLGFSRGFLREVMSLATWVAAGALSWLFAANIAPLFSSWLRTPASRTVAGYVSVFVVVFVAGTVLGYLIRRGLLVRPWTRFVNYLLGGVTGALRGMFVLVLAVLVAGLTPAPRQSWWHHSMFIPMLENTAQVVTPYLPRDVLRYISYN